MQNSFQATENHIWTHQIHILIRGIINEPAVVLADEPTSALDDENCAQVIKLLEEQTYAVGAALVVVTHDQRLKDFFTNSIAL